MSGFGSSMATYSFLHFFLPALFDITISEEQKMIASLIVGLSITAHNVGVLSSNKDNVIDNENNEEYIQDGSNSEDLEKTYTADGYAHYVF